MKKILYVMPLLAMALTACDPSEIEGGSEWSQFDINQLQATATPQEVNGMNGNVIHVVSNSPVVTAWDADQLIENTTHTVTTEGNIYVTKLGANIIRVSATNNGGSPAVKEITVQIDTISYITDAIKNRLCIGQRGAPTYFGKGFNVANITVSQTIDNLTGKPGNSINITKNTNPALCTFRWGSSSIDTNIGKIVTYALDEEQELFVDFQDARGVTATFSLGKFTAEAYSDLPAGIYEGTQQVRLSAVSSAQNAQVVYTTDGTTPTATSNPVSNGFILTVPVGTMTLTTGLLVNGQVSDITSRTYTVKEKESEKPVVIPSFCQVSEGEICAFFEAPATWTATIMCWAWSDSPAENFTSATGSWPGIACTLLGTADNGNKVWKWTWNGIKQHHSSAEKPAKIIFSSNGSPQTDDLLFQNAGYYNKDGLKGIVGQ